MTDLPNVIPILEYNIQANEDIWRLSGGDATSRPLTWGQEYSIDQPINVLLLADCVYYSESVQALVETMCQVSNENTEVIICQENRDSEKQRVIWKSIMNHLNEFFVVKGVPFSEQDPLFRSHDISLLKATRITK